MIWRCVQKVVKDRAAECGQLHHCRLGLWPFFLQDRPDVMSIFLFAQREFKLNFLKETLKDNVRAHELVDSVDRKRRAFVKHYFGVEWPWQPFTHAGMLNNALGDDFILTTIENLMKRLNNKDAAA